MQVFSFLDRIQQYIAFGPKDDLSSAAASTDICLWSPEGSCNLNHTSYATLLKDSLYVDLAQSRDNTERCMANAEVVVKNGSIWRQRCKKGDYACDHWKASGEWVGGCHLPHLKDEVK